MKVRILHLFYDLMNMYGDYGNVSILCKRLEELGMQVTLDKKTVGDVLIDGDYDFIYCGAGTELKRNKALETLRPEKDALQKAIESGTQVLFTGNSWEILGKRLLTVDSERLDGLGIFDFETVEDSDRRVTGDIIAYADFLDEPVCGFVNKCGSVSGITTPLFDKITLGPGNSKGSNAEGFRYKNFYGTELIGPLLVKNPHFLKMIMKALCGDSYKDIPHVPAEKAYEVTINALSER